jgi:CelD/BcsL family acetyltransferase involved in cellulose biosynthesis
MLLREPVAQNFAIEEIRSGDDAEALRAEWSALWDRCPNGTPFQTPEWQLAWWNVFGADKELWLLSIRETGTRRLVALLPAMILREQSKVMLAGVAVSDELDILAEPEFTQSAAEIFIDHIRNERRRWSQCELSPLPECSPFRPGARVCDVTPIVDLAEPIPSNMRRNLRRYRRRAEKFGRVEFDSASEQNFDEVFNAVIDLHCARWNRRDQPGVMCEDAVRRFHIPAARALFHRGMSRVYAVRIDGRIVAGVYALISRDQMRSYIGGFDPNLPTLSLGTLAIGHAIDEAKREGARTFNFLRGAERYKGYWGARNHYVYSRQLIA